MYGNRAAKWTLSNSSETLYFNTMWTWHTDKGLPEGQYSKHIYLGETRVVTKQTSKLEASYGQSDEWHHRYYYHPDHLGSAQLVTDYEGNEYQRIEYTPYGELWVEKKTEKEEGLRYLPYKFTAKEQDEETGLYYYGARYLDAKYSRWLSADPAVGEYIPVAPTDDNARKHNEKLPGMGGVFNVVNFQLYHYAGNNPVKYTDPDGRNFFNSLRKFIFGFKTSLMTLDYPLGRANNFDDSRSIYLKQYGTTYEHERGLCTIISGFGLVPGVVGEVATVSGLLVKPTSEKNIVTFGDRKSFIAGAQNEINRIDAILANLTDTDGLERNAKGTTYIDFLNDQKDKLKQEVVSNSNADDHEVGGIEYTMQLHGQGHFLDKRKATPPSYAKPVDYYAEFKSQQRAMDE